METDTDDFRKRVTRYTEGLDWGPGRVTKWEGSNLSFVSHNCMKFINLEQNKKGHLFLPFLKVYIVHFRPRLSRLTPNILP